MLRYQRLHLNPVSAHPVPPTVYVMILIVAARAWLYHKCRPCCARIIFKDLECILFIYDVFAIAKLNYNWIDTLVNLFVLIIAFSK